MAYRYFETEVHASLYTKFRPKTPDLLAQRIVQYVSEKLPGTLKVAVDVGCGTGQSTEVLAPYFSNVYGFDANETAINEATKKANSPNVKYGTSPAEKLTVEDNSVTLVTAGQAVHWFNIPLFFEEVKRILVPGGALALYGYQLPKPVFPGPTNKDLSPIVDKFYYGEISSLRRPELIYFEKEYTNIEIPLEDTERDETVYVEEKGTIADLVGHVSTWSGFQKYKNQNGKDKAASLLMDFEQELMTATGSKLEPEETEIIVRYKYFLVLGRKPM